MHFTVSLSCFLTVILMCYWTCCLRFTCFWILHLGPLFSSHLVDELCLLLGLAWCLSSCLLCLLIWTGNDPRYETCSILFLKTSYCLISDSQLSCCLTELHPATCDYSYIPVNPESLLNYKPLCVVLWKVFCPSQVNLLENTFLTLVAKVTFFAPYWLNCSNPVQV